MTDVMADNAVSVEGIENLVMTLESNPGATAPSPAESTPRTVDTNNDDAAAAASTAPAPALPAIPKFTGKSKTDKPKPHICESCTRPFARLEHLKRHERSHTKEKPFNCEFCPRSFSRRDLLLRHQQKLHQDQTAPLKPRNKKGQPPGTTRRRGRQTSIASGGSGDSPASLANVAPLVALGANGHPAMRPRANTMNIGSLQHHVIPPPPQPMHSRHPSLSDLPIQGFQQQFSFQQAMSGMQSELGQRSLPGGLSLATTIGAANTDYGLRSTPAFSFGDFDLNSSLFSNAGSTIDPNALHCGDSQTLGLDPASIFPPNSAAFSDLASVRDSFSWIHGFSNQLNLAGSAIDENAIASSPSEMTDSPGDMSDMLETSTQLDKLDNSGFLSNQATTTEATPSLFSMAGNQMSFFNDTGSSLFTDLLTDMPMSPTMNVPGSQAPMINGSGAQGSPHPQQNGNIFFPASTSQPGLRSADTMLTFGHSLGMNGGMGSESPNLDHYNVSSLTQPSHAQPLMNGSSPVSTITDATRLAIVGALNSTGGHKQSFATRRYSFGGVAPTLSPSPEQSVPSTVNLKKYVAAYLRCFHPHFPFLHVGTLSFEIKSPPTLYPTLHGSNPNTVGGVGCLVLSMAAIGAMYEHEQDQSRLLFAMAKRMIQLYLDERRKANVRKADFFRQSSETAQQRPNSTASSDTPVWLVQAMLLNVVYGHNGSDKRAGEIAATHCAALVSLAQGADLFYIDRVNPPSEMDAKANGTIDPNDVWNTAESLATSQTAKDELLWLRWKEMEERKRTLYAIFVLSSLLVSSYNHTPALTNSEVLLDLPCDEEFYAAPTCAEFMAKGGVAAANHNRMTFHDALGNLLRASERMAQRSQGFDFDHAMEPRPGTFGCFVLINALHNYIWETRQRHPTKVWTNEDTDKMHRHIEPALQAWHRAWKNRPLSETMPLSSAGMDAVTADCMPLLALAYVRLFVNLSRSKEKFWQRNWDAIAQELSQSAEIAGQSPSETGHADLNLDLSSSAFASNINANGPAMRREKHLRRAAFFAVDALSVAAKAGYTLSDLDLASREIPLQSALCAFDCAQVLAEWVATLQDRVGRYLGVLDENLDVTQVPAIMLLEDDDVRLLTKIRDMLSGAQRTMSSDLTSGIAEHVASVSSRMAAQLQLGEAVGYGAKVLGVTAYTLGKASVWPVTHLMAECLENHANHVHVRAERSVHLSD